MMPRRLRKPAIHKSGVNSMFITHTSSRRSLAGRLAGAIALGATALSVTLAPGPALADPNNGNPGQPPVGKTPSQIVAGVGADANAELFNSVAKAYNEQQPAPDALLASYDAVNPATGVAGENVVTKPGCAVPRPNGANAAATALLNPAYISSAGSGGDGTSPCIDFARMSRSKKTDGSEASLTYYALQRDAVTWSSVGHSYAPRILTTAQLKEIFECSVTDWSEVGGQKGNIHVYINATSAATYTFFLQTIGSSVNAVQTGCGSSLRVVQQNDGTKLAGDPQGIAPYGVTKWSAEKNQPVGISDIRGGTILGKVNNQTSPTTNEVVGNTTYTILNPSFASGGGATQGRLIFNAVRNTAPDSVKDIFKPGGYICANQNALLIPFGAPPLGNDTNANNYCGQAS